jgi:hypothetical protein
MVTFIYGYDIWRTANPGETGWCNNPTKRATVGAVVKCDENWSAVAILQCWAEAAICASLCKGAKTKLQLAACAGCLVLYGFTCAKGGLCVFVKECEPSNDPDDQFPIQKDDVVDSGADWGDGCTGN